MDRTEQIKFETLQLQFILTNLLKKREALYLKGLNDEKINDKIRVIQTKIRNYANTKT
jgi:hypothetical protein